MELLRGGELLDAVMETVGGWADVCMALAADGVWLVWAAVVAVGVWMGGRRCRCTTTAAILTALLIPRLLSTFVQGHYTEAGARTVFRQLVLAIQYLHSQ